MTAKSLVVSLTVVTKDPDAAARAAEVMARAASGLALDGIDINLTLGNVDDEDDLE